MRRLRAPFEGQLACADVAVHWKFDGANVTARTTIYNLAGTESAAYANTSSFRLGHIALAGASPGNHSLALYGTSAVSGSLIIAGGWYTAASAGAVHRNLATDWSVAMWLQDSVSQSNATQAYVEYSQRETVTANTVNCLGIYGQPTTTGKISVRWDISTTTTQVIDTEVTVETGAAHHYTFVHRSPVSGASVGVFEVWKDARLAHTSTTWFSTAASSSNTSTWNLGASKRYGTSTGGTPAFVSTVSGRGPRMDDFLFIKEAISPAKIRGIYADAARSWDEAALLRGGDYRVEHRVLLRNGLRNSDWIDLRDFRDHDWTVEATVSDSVEDDHKKAKIRLRRRFGNNLDLSRLNSNAALTYVGGYPILDLRARVQVEVAVVPADWRIQGWEWVPQFDGLIDSVDWGGDEVSVDATDLGAALDDVYRVDARRYEYGPASTTQAEEHIQTLIDDNEPKTIRPGSAGGLYTWGYVGGIKPNLYTPYSSGWTLRYEHGGNGSVLKLLQGVADQIGWDLKYRPYEPLESDRPTFFSPPRALNIALNGIQEDENGFALVSFVAPHGLQVGQTVTISGTTNYNTSDARVDEVVDWRRVRLNFQPSGTPAAETSGTVVYGYHAEIPLDSVLGIGQVSSNVTDIRNHIVVRFDRKDSPATLFATTVYESGGVLYAEFDEGKDVSMLEVGNDATITSPTGGGFSATRAISSVSGNRVGMTPTGVAAAASTSSACFSSEYLSFGTSVSVATSSVTRYGLRTAAIFEQSIEGVDNFVEAARLSSGVLSDLSDPTVDMSGDFKCLPWVDLYDLLRLADDPLGRWVAMNVAVVGYTHTFGAESHTSLQLRHNSPTKGRAWLTRGHGILAELPGNWAPPINMPTNLIGGDGSDFGNVTFDNSIGPFFMASWARPQGRRAWLHDRTEIHISSSSAGFLPSDGMSAGMGGSAATGTLHHTTRGTHAHISEMGDRLGRGRMYFAKIRHRDKYGNLTGTLSSATSLLVRYMPKPAAALGAYLSTVTTQILQGPVGGGAWSAFPIFASSGSSPGFDNYSNLSHWNGGASGGTTAQYTHLSSSAFIMPCDGEVKVQGRIGLVVDNGKSTKELAIGLFLIGSTLPGSSSCLPFLIPRITPHSGSLVQTTGQVGVIGFLMGTDIKTSSFYVNENTQIQLATLAWFSFCETLSAHSGNKILVGINGGNGNNARLHCVGTTFTSCTSWVKFTVTAQD